MAELNEVIGNEDPNTLNGEDGEDAIYGYGGNDTINAQDGNDYVWGGDGNDTIHGQGGDDALYGEGGNDTITGNNGTDSLFGGAGDDTLTGNNGADKFNFVFNSSSSNVADSFGTWLVEHGYGSAVDGNGIIDGALTQSQFSVQYTAWLSQLVSQYGIGIDTDGDGHVGVALNQNDPNGTPWIEGLTPEQLNAMFSDANEFTVRTGKTTQERYYADSFTTGQFTITSADGHDEIKDFSRAEGDKLAFTGVTLAQFNQWFDVTVVDADDDGFADDTLISLVTDPSWSVALIGVTNFDASQDMLFS